MSAHSLAEVFVARPKSEEKRLALLDAATEVVAAQGLEARTASVAQRAGVAEGTLFRYFATKDVLLNELFLHLKQSLTDARPRSTAKAPLKGRLKSLWDGYIDWGVSNPAAIRALNQLALSETITADTRAKAARIDPAIREVATACIARGALAGQPAFADAIFLALADTTIQFAVRDPRHADAYKSGGFSVLWEGLTR